MRHFNVDTIAGQWKYHVLKIIQNGEYHDSKIKKKALDTAAKLYSEDKRFFFNVGDGDINSTKGIIRYLGRYLARSPIAEYKITEIDDDNVTFFFNDLANNKKKTFITMPAEKFISQILIHLPPKNFKMVTGMVSIQDIFPINLKRLWSLLRKILPYQNIHFIKDRCT